MGCYVLASSACSLTVTADGSRTVMVSGRECSRAERARQSKCGGTWTRGERTLQGKVARSGRSRHSTRQRGLLGDLAAQASASSSALASWRSAVSKPSVNQP
jgi:hypothetical protein